MEIRDLEDYLAVVEHGSILGAAEARAKAQPALSRRIRALEKRLGVQLLTRSSQGVTPTVYGSLLERHARLVIRTRQQALDELQSLRDGVEGHARIGVGPTLVGVLSEAIQNLSQERSGLSFSVIEGAFDSFVRDLRNGELDGAFTLIVPGEPHEGLAVQRLDEDPVLVLASTEHRLRRKRNVSFSDVVDERWAISSRPRSIIDFFRRTAAAHGVESPNICVETDSLGLLKSLITKGPMLTAMPQRAFAFELEQGFVCALPVEGLPAIPTGFLHRQEVRPPAVQLLLEAVRATIGV